MQIGKKLETDRECCEKGRLWNDYILHLTNAFLVSRIPATRLLISFDVLISLIHFTAEQADRNEHCRLYRASGEPADIESIPATDRYVYSTSQGTIEVMVDMVAHPDTVEFA